MWETFQNCGWPSWLILLLAGMSFFVTLVAIILSLVKQAKAGIIVGLVSVMIALLSAATGPGGMLLGQQTTDRAIAGVDPQQRERIRAMGYEEAGGCMVVGVSLGGPALLASACATGLALALMKKRNVGTA